MNLLRKIGTISLGFGLDPRKTLSSIMAIPGFVRDFIWFIRFEHDNFAKSLLPILSDKVETAGIAKGHYFWCDLITARWIRDDNPDDLLDVGSRIDGFVAHVLCFRSIDVVDVRKLESQVDGINFIQSDFTKPNTIVGEYSAISSLHAIEHFGLGRYGDPLVVDGWKTALCNFHLNLKENGFLYLAAPISYRNTVHFNAHRTFELGYLLEACENIGFELLETRIVDDEGNYLGECSLPPKCYKYSCAILKFRCLK